MPRFENVDFSIFRVFLGPNKFLCLSNFRVHRRVVVTVLFCCFTVKLHLYSSMLQKFVGTLCFNTVTRVLLQINWNINVATFFVSEQRCHRMMQ